MKKQRTLSIILILALLCGALFTGCGEKEAETVTPSSEKEAETVTPGGEKEAETITLGWIGPLTGDMTIWGTAEMQAITIAIEEVNEEGGILGKQVELKTYDNRGDAVETTNAAKKAIQQDGCIAIFGCNTSSTAIALSEVCTDLKIPQIATTATNSKLTQNDDGTVHPYTFRVCLSDPQMGDVMAQYAFKEMGLRKVAIIYEIGSDYSLGVTQNFTDSFTNCGGEIVISEAYNTGDVDFRAQLTKIAQADFEALFIPANYKEVGLVANQARSMGITQQLIGPDAWQVDDLFDLAAEAMEGGYFVSGTDITSESLKGFGDKFKERWDYYPSEVGTNAYFATDAFIMLKSAIEAAGSVDSEAIRDELEKTTDLQCLTSKITVMPENHNPLRSATIFTIKDSSFVHVTEFEITE